MNALLSATPFLLCELLNVYVILSSNYYKIIKIKRNVKEPPHAGKSGFGAGGA